MPLLELLLDQSKINTDVKDFMTGNTPLHRAAFLGKVALTPARLRPPRPGAPLRYVRSRRFCLARRSIT